MKRYYDAIIIMLIMIVLSSIILIIKPAPTGFVVYEGSQESRFSNLTKIWNFSDPEEYSYNSEILVNNSQASLNPITTIYNWTEERHHDYITSYALYNPTDKIDKLEEDDNSKFTPNEGKILNIIFEESLGNGDIISIYIDSSPQTNIYLCEVNTICISPGYGSVSYGGGEGVYNITLSGLDYPKNYLSIVAPDVKLDYITSNKGNITHAFYDPADKLDKINQKDNNNFEIRDSDIFDVKFNSSIYNNDIISFYLKSGDASKLFICNPNTECNTPGYGELAYNDQEGWYNLSLSNLTHPMSSFNINSNDDVKIDFIQATRINITNYTSINITYAVNSTIQTSEITRIRGIKSVEFISELNNQTITYKYSSDSGNTWNNIPDNFSLLNISRIKFSAALTSDTFKTPILSAISTVYDKEFPKIYHETNTSALVNLSSFEPTIINKSNIILNITVSQDIDNANITIKEFSNSSMEFKRYLRNLIDIAVDNTTRNYLNSTEVKIYYTDEEISQANLDESTLKFYYYNETSLRWQELDSAVDVENNFIEVSISHLSIYGVFGDEKQLPSSSGGSGGRSTQESKKSIDSKNQEVIKSPSESTIIPQGSSTVENITAEGNSEIIEKEEEGVTGFTIFGIEIKGIGLGNVLVLVAGFLLATSYGIFRIARKRRAKHGIEVYIDKENKVAVRQK